MEKRVLIPLVLLLGLQGLDVLLHAATDQLEPIRVTSNALISVGALASALHLTPSRITVGIAGLGYLALNLAFLGEHGLINPATQGWRFPLFGFVAGSLFLLSWIPRPSGP